MTTFIVKRLVTLVPVIFVVSVVLFLMIHAAPGDPVTIMAGDWNVSAEDEQRIREELGLLDPLHVQFGRWWLGVLHGNLGRSLSGRGTVSEAIGQRFPATVELAAFAMAVAVAAGVVVGIVSAYKKYTWFDNTSRLVALVGVSFPSFWLGLVAMYVFAVKLRWVAVSGRLGTDTDLNIITGLYLVDSLATGNPAAFVDALRHLALPALVLGAIQAAFIARMTRASMLDILEEEYIRTARAKGLSETTVLLRHALRNALVPIVTIVGLQIGFLLGGTIIVETVFSWPGVGTLLIESVLSRDYPMVLGVTMVTACIFVMVNLVVDVLYTILNPQIRVG